MLLTNNQNLGSANTTKDLKQYFDIASYRNVLDMLNTFDGVLNLWGDDLYNIVVGVYFSPAKPTAIGYAIKKIGNKRGAAQIYAINQLNKNGLNRKNLNAGIRFPNFILSRNRIARKYRVPTNNFEIRDLLLLARNMNWELNRLRLPIPANFRQINSAIQGRAYKSSNDYINLVQLIDVYGQLKKAIAALRVGVRKEIDAANLASKVREDTLRVENAAIITREAAKIEAEKRRLQILEEKKIAYEKELSDATKLKEELAATRRELEAELKNFRELNTVATPQESEALTVKATETVKAIESLDVVVTEKDKSLVTTRQAAQNVDTDIKKVIIEIKQKQNNPVEQVLSKPKSPIVPVLLTIAAGVILT